MIGDDVDHFRYLPSTWKITTGNYKEDFQITAKSTTAPGLYQIQFSHSETRLYSPIPSLNLLVLNDPCKIAAEYSSYTIVNAGSSLPIVFDFSSCMPGLNITMTGIAYSIVNGSQIKSPYVSFDENNITLVTNISSSSATQIVFTLTRTQQQDTENLQATLNFTFSGANAASYIFDQIITVEIITLSMGAPIITMETIFSSTPGEQSFTAQCNQIGIIYYAISQSIDKIEAISSYKLIKNNLKNNMIKMTELGDFYQNEYRTIYGYSLQEAANNSVEIVITGKIESSAKYYGRMICINQNEMESNFIDFSWIQASNNAKPLILKLLFLSTETTAKSPVTLSVSQRNELTCIISELTYKSKEYVLNSQGGICDDSIDESSGNETNSTNETTSDSGLRNLEESNYSNYYEYILILPDPFVGEDKAIQEAETILKSSDFTQQLLSSLSSLFSFVLMSENSCTTLESYPTSPVLTAPTISFFSTIIFNLKGPNESSLSLSFTIQNTNGFIFIGLVKAQNELKQPSIIQLKQNSGYDFNLHVSQFLLEDTKTTITLSPLDEFSEYMLYWIATSEYPYTSLYQTELRMSEENITTTGEQIQDAYYFISGVRLSNQFLLCCCIAFAFILSQNN